MPEIITKYPEIVLQILRESGAECGTGVVQRILTNCPPERFCSLPTGEICVYGLNEISKMTQISINELTKIVSTAQVFSLETVFIGISAFVIGIVVGLLWKKSKK